MQWVSTSMRITLLALQISHLLKGFSSLTERQKQFNPVRKILFQILLALLPLASFLAMSTHIEQYF